MVTEPRVTTRTDCGCAECCRLCRTREPRVPCGHGKDSYANCSPPAARPRHRQTESHRGVTAHLTQRLFIREFALALLLVPCLVQSVAAGPARRKQHWTNPCTLNLATLAVGAASQRPTSSDTQILNRIIQMNNLVQPEVEDTINRFVRTIHGTSPGQMERDWGHHQLDWLEFVEREAAAGQPPSLSAALRGHFGGLQRLAVGLEQMTLSAALHGDRSLRHLRRLQPRLMKLLCELHLGLLEKGLSTETSVSAAELQRQHQQQPQHRRERNMHGWILLREYQDYVQHLGRVLMALRDSSSR